MKIAILATGSRGDVQPYIALGHGLQRAGHAVQILSTTNFAALIAAYNLPLTPIGGDLEVEAQARMSGIAERGNAIQILRETGRGAAQMARQTVLGGQQACVGSDLLIAGLGGLFVGMALAEKLRIPLIQAYLMPLSPTRAFGSVLTPTLPTWANRASHHLARQMLWQMFRAADQITRREMLDLPAPGIFGPHFAEAQGHAPVLYGYSPHVIAKPADWGAALHVTGYWFLDEPSAWQPPDELAAFLAAGAKPIYIGFGSMPSRDAAATAKLVIEALTQTGQRAILYRGWGGIAAETLPPNVLLVDSVPHSWLFPRMAAIVHHGGAGTTAAGLRAGVPNIVVPFFGDQPFWGQRVAQLGVGPQPLARRTLSAENLGAALSIASSDSAMQQRAALLGNAIRAEDGVGSAVALIERYART